MKVGQVAVAAAIVAWLLTANSMATVRAAGPLDANAQRFRESMGFATDPAVLSAQSMTQTSQQKYGVPLTGIEEADIDGRIVLQESLTPLVDFVNAHSDVLGGVWLDQTATGGRGAMVNITSINGADPNLLRKAAALVPAGTAIALPKGESVARRAPGHFRKRGARRFVPPADYISIGRVPT
jgi:hypothetical protein